MINRRIPQVRGRSYTPALVRLDRDTEIVVPQNYERLIRMVRSSGSEGLTLDAICERMYLEGWSAHDAMRVRNTMTVRIHYLNKRYLRPDGWQISANNRYNERSSFGVYRLRRLNSYETRPIKEAHPSVGRVPMPQVRRIQPSATHKHRRAPRKVTA